MVSIDDDALFGLDTLKTLKLQNNSLHLSDYLFRVQNPDLEILDISKKLPFKVGLSKLHVAISTKS